MDKQQATPEQPKYETRDVNLRLIVISIVGLSILIILSLVAVQGLTNFLTRQANSQSVPPRPLAEEQAAPKPRLQASPADDLRTLRAKEDAILNHYGWVNKEAGIVHIPIERAMELTLERGLPTRPGK